MNENVCIKEGCEKEVHVRLRGLCRSHYHAWSQQNRPRVGHTPCDVDECEKTVYAKGFCRSHYTRNWATGSPLPVVKMCDCGEVAMARGMCKKHYMSWYYYHQTEVSGNNKGKNRKEVPGYAQAHNRVRAVKGRAADHLCIDCGEQANQWSLSADATEVHYGPSRLDRSTLTKYSLNVDDYEPRCRNCHSRYDAETGNRSYKTGKYAKNRGDNA